MATGAGVTTTIVSEGLVGREAGEYFYDNPEQGEAYGEMVGAEIYYVIDITLSIKGKRMQ